MDEINDKINSFVVGGKYGFEFIPLEDLAETVGVSVVGLRFIMGIIVGYPFAMLYLLFPKTAYNKKHLFFTVTGIIVNYFCFGADCVYNLFSIFLSYVSLVVFGATMKNVMFNLFFHTIYLTVGYIVNASDNYDVKWTTPQCILCLRLIGLAWDVYDGQQSEESLSAEQMKYRIVKKPSFMELFGFSYCFCGCLSGPQFSFKRYIRFVGCTLVDKDVEDQQSNRFYACIKRLMAALMVMAFFATFDSSYRCDMLLQPVTLKKSFHNKVILMGLIYYVQFAKYVFVWWFAESICMLIGISYNGKDENGSPKWDGLNNFKFRKFFFGAFFQDIIESFNIQTNKWSARYIFKRLRFLGNKVASHVLTLLYLSVWHGFYIGYPIMFLFEYMSVIMEKQLCEICYKVSKTTFANLSLSWKIPIQAFGAIYKFACCGFFVQAFMLLRWRRIKVAYASVYYWPVVVMTSWLIVINPVISAMIKGKKRDTDELKKEK